MSIEVSERLLNITLPKEINHIINETKRYAAGNSILINIKNNKDLKNIKTILNIRDS